MPLAHTLRQRDPFRPASDLDLLEAAARGDIGGLRAAMAEGARALDDALSAAASAGESMAAAYLIDSGADPRARHSEALRLAARDGRAETLRLLLDRGADLHAMGDCALYWAVANDRPDAARELIARGADLEALSGHPIPSRGEAARLAKRLRWKRRAARWLKPLSPRLAERLAE